MTLLEITEALTRIQRFLAGVTWWGLDQPEGAPDLHATKQTVKQLIEHHQSIPKVDPVQLMKDLVGPSGLITRGEAFQFSVAVDSMTIEFKEAKAIIMGSWQGKMVWTETIDFVPGQNLNFAEILLVRDLTRT